MNPILTIVVSFVSAVLASVISPFIIYRLNERQRKLELYKIVYPEQFKATQTFMANAYALQIEVICAFNSRGQAPWFSGPLVEHIKQFRQQAEAIQWLLGPQVVDVANEIYSVIVKAESYPVQANFEVALSEAYRHLDGVFTKEMHLNELKKLFSD